MSLDVMVGLGLLAILVVAIVAFALLFGHMIGRTASRIVTGKADSSDGLSALLAVGVIGADPACDAGAGGCD